MDPPTRRQSVQAGGPPPPVVILFFFLMWMYVSPSNDYRSSTLSPHDLFTQKLNREWHQLDVLNQTRWGDFAPRLDADDPLAGGGMGSWLNMTGFRKGDRYAWSRLKRVQQRFDVFRKEYGIPFEEDNSEPETGKQSETEEDTHQQPAMYQNLSGIVSGPWVRSQGLGFEGQQSGSRHHPNISEIAPNTFWAWDELNRNITGDEGKVMMSLYRSNINVGRESLEPNLRLKNEPTVVSASLYLKDDVKHDGWEIDVHGVHWPESGELLLTTTSDKFAGLYGLPHLTRNPDHFNSSQHVMNDTLGYALRKSQEYSYRTGDVLSGEELVNPRPHCEYIVYVQVHAIPTLPQSSVDAIEQELLSPKGAPLANPPPLEVSFVIFSPDCDFVLESKGPPSYVPAEGQHLKGWKSEVYISTLKSLILLMTGILFAQVMLQVQQQKDASTPSTVGRISLYTIGMLTAADFLTFFLALMLGSTLSSLYPTMYVTAFFGCMGSVLGGRFLADITKVQEPERLERQRTRERQRARAEAARASQNPPPPGSQMPILSAAGADVPGPVASPPSDDPSIIIPSDQDIDAEIAQSNRNATPSGGLPAPATAARPTQRQAEMWNFASSIGPLLFSMTAFFLITAHSLTWPPFYRNIYINTLALIYLSMWWPQIYRNIVRNCRRALLKRFVIGQSLCRLAPFAYFYLIEGNVSFAETSPVAMGCLAMYVWAQIWILLLQEVLGPRFGLPAKVTSWLDLPEAWEYHPILREDDVEGGGMPIGLVQAPHTSPSVSRTSSNVGEVEHLKKHDGHSRTVDCAICMNVLEVPVLAAGEETTGGVQGMFERRKYMVTPCRHVFHSECLEGWMKFRLQCPICREALPPL